MREQGIPEQDISINLDSQCIGSLLSAMERFAEIGNKKIDTWYMQDDVVISRDFAEKSQNTDFNGVIMGFLHQYKGYPDLHPGKTPVSDMGYSFPCMMIPWKIADEFATWFYCEASKQEHYQEWIRAGKYEDSFFRDFMMERHQDGWVYNLRPSIVEHIDWLIGGSTINKWRPEICRATYWDDESIVEELKDKLAHRK